MKSKWPALLITVLLNAGWACSSNVESLPRSTAGESGTDAGMAGALDTGGQSGKGGAPAHGGAENEAGAAGAAGGEAGAAANGGVGGDPTAPNGGAGAPDAGSAGAPEAGSAGAPEELPDCTGCSVQEVETPAWHVASALLTVAPVGSATGGNDSYYLWLANLFAPNHQLIDNIYGPGVPHAAPYDQEVFNLLQAANGEPQQTVSTAEFGAPNGVALIVTLTPKASAPLGSSPDFASGPILPNALFPLFVDGNLYRNGDLYDGQFDDFYPGYDALSTPIAKAGASHYILLFAENSSYFPDVEATGSYVFRISILDVSSSGWVLDVPFTVQ